MDGDQKMNEKLAGRSSAGPTMQEEMLETLQQIEKHLKAMVYYATPERAFQPSAGKAAAPPPSDSSLQEMIANEIQNYLKENS